MIGDPAHKRAWRAHLQIKQRTRAITLHPRSKGKAILADILAGCDAYTLVCGGDTVAAVEAFGVADKMGYLSTGGGAFLEVLEGKTLPAVAALADCAK